MHESFLRQYDKITNPMDILLACGVNNISSSESAERVIVDFKAFIQSIRNHSQRNNHKYNLEKIYFLIKMGGGGLQGYLLIIDTIPMLKEKGVSRVKGATWPNV